MKRPKERLNRVIVIGATPSGIAATNKLGEIGIPVTLVDTDPDLDRKLAREEWRLPSGMSLNFAHRSGLLRIMRNPIIRRILPARVLSLKHTPQGFRAKVEKLQAFVDPSKCVLCGRCEQVCPVRTPDGGKPIQFLNRRSVPGRPIIDKRKKPLCQSNCPLGVNAQAYIALAREGRFREALDIVRKDNVLPGICGRVCTHPCEMACRRGELDEPIAIRDIKRYLVDYEIENPRDSISPEIPDNAKRVAVIGSGPAGLAAAAELSGFGYGVVVFEKEPEAGGLLRYGIGKHRLPREILDFDIEYVRQLGVNIETSYDVEIPGGLEKMKKDFDAIVIATGTWEDRKLGVRGESMEGIEGCISILTRVNRGEIKELDENVAVIGDGNAAFDLARTLNRLGARVTLLSWFSMDRIPADNEEIRAAGEEGIIIAESTQVVAFMGDGNKVEYLKCRPTQPGDPDEKGIPWPVIVPGSESFDLKFDRAIVAIGQKGVFHGSERPQGDGETEPRMRVSESGLIQVGETFLTDIENVYAAGDAVTGPAAVIQAMANGRAAARAVHADLGGSDLQIRDTLRPDDRDFAEIPADIPSLARPTMPERQPGARLDNFCEVALGLSESQVISESERCLQCGICSECFLCEEVCGDIGAIIHHEKNEQIIEHAGAVIITEPDAAPAVKGEDVIRAYGPKAAKSDVLAMITRGFAAASKATVLVGGASHGPKGHGLSFTPPDPELSPDIRIGVFACRCNDLFGWTDDMYEYVYGLKDSHNIVHAEVMLSACVPEGSSSILKTIREKGLTRVVLASCVCCPLDFVCSACTDQRSRLKEALFRGTGISRSMVETCNLRGEVLRYMEHDTTDALNRLKGLMDRSVQRAAKLKPLPSPIRNYNFATAVIGESEAVISSAVTLAEVGLEVFHFGGPHEPLSKNLNHQNIHFFKGSVVKGMSGVLGNFQVFVDMNGFSQVLEVGAVIIGDKHRRLVPYIVQEGLPSVTVGSSVQKRGHKGVPYLLPGATSIAGLFLADLKGIHVSQRKKGAAAAALAAAVMPRGPRQSKGYTVVVDNNKCRGCGRCIKSCMYQAISFQKNSVDGWHAVVDEALCKGCGNCISVCPSNAADSPYRDQAYLEQMLEEIILQ